MVTASPCHVGEETDQPRNLFHQPVQGGTAKLASRRRISALRGICPARVAGSRR
jgi:hypothetical protein